MNQELVNIQRQIDTLSKTLTNTTLILSIHKHTGQDQTSKLPAVVTVTPPKSYGGNITSLAAAGAYFPTGWTVGANGTGNIIVTHNLGTIVYAVVACLDGGGTGYVSVNSETTTSFNLNISDTASAAASHAVNFILVTG